MAFYLSTKGTGACTTLLNQYGLYAPEYLSKLETRNLFNITVGSYGATYGYCGYGVNKFGSISGSPSVGGRGIIELSIMTLSGKYTPLVYLSGADSFTAGVIYVSIQGYVYALSYQQGTWPTTTGTPPNEYPARVAYRLPSDALLTYNPFTSLLGLTTPVVVWYQ